MCSIIGSFSKTKFKELVTINQNRGSFSYSFMVYNPITNKIISLDQEFGEFPLSIVENAPNDMYYIGHTQAPTGGLIKDKDRIHPAQINNQFLFHNGIIKQRDVERLQSLYNTTEGWDSKLMLQDITVNGLDITLNTIDGSFACVYNDGNKINIFRSAAGVLFVDTDLNISSTKFEGAERIENDKIFSVDFSDKVLTINGIFKSKSSPYFY